MMHMWNIFSTAKFLIGLYSGVTTWEHCLVCFITPELCTEAETESNRIKDESYYYYGKGYKNDVLCAKIIYLHAQKLGDK